MFTVFAANFLGKEFNFEPRPGSFILLSGFGFVVAVIGHMTASKTIILSGIGLICAGILFAPLALYLSGRG